MLQSLKGSEAVELVEGKIRKKENPAVWAIPPDQPITGIWLKNVDVYYSGHALSFKKVYRHATEIYWNKYLKWHG